MTNQTCEDKYQVGDILLYEKGNEKIAGVVTDLDGELVVKYYKTGNSGYTYEKLEKAVKLGFKCMNVRM